MVISTNSPAIAGKNRCLLLIVLEEKLLLQLLLQLHAAYGLQQSNRVLDFEHLFVVPWTISQCYLPETSRLRFDFFKITFNNYSFIFLNLLAELFHITENPFCFKCLFGAA